MPLFQKSVQTTYLNDLDKSLLDAKFQQLKSYFGNPDIQDNIRNAKEEQFQEGFLRELFVNILGYTLNPEPDYNLTTEFKNVTGSKKADGAILRNDHAIAVIELKSTTTADLDAVESQAFGYKNHHPKCLYVITSNFEKIRFYIQNAVDFIEFNLFTLSRQDFALLWLCLSQNSIFKDLPLRLKEASVLQEENITKKLYADYADFRTAIFEDIVAGNPDKDKLVLFKKTQKLLDRFIFIFFAEDRQLLPPNSTIEIINQWSDLKDKYDQYVPLYDRFKKYFGYLNTGHQGKHHDIYPYNGGLFAPDDILDHIHINDDILYNHTLKLSTYDFNTELDEDILGHIFENSIVEIEAVQAEIKGQDVDRKKSKRKKDGIYYTEKFITKTMVENTVGKLCAEKRQQLGIVDEDYHAKQRKDVKRKLLDKLDTYRLWLLGITICDPACGSGAFLIQALDFLIEEHQKIDQLRANLLNESLILSDIRNEILEKNLYGVDINEESVEIAKLSLWLRTAQKNRKLNSLSSNIKCGNSLFQDPNIDNEKAFDWEKEFPEVFANGGFDIIIGNPPYVSRGMTEAMKKALMSLYETSQYQLDLYIAFIEKGIKLLKNEGYISYITPNSWLKNIMMSECRKFILNNLCLFSIFPSLEKVFPDASVDTLIFIGKKEKRQSQINVLEFRDNQIILRHTIEQKRFNQNDGFIFDVEISDQILPIIQKLQDGVLPISDLFDVSRGINPYDKYTGQSQEVINSKAYHADHKKDSTFVPEIRGKHISRYFHKWDGKHFISYGNWLAAPREEKYFEGERIVFREILGKQLVSTLVEESIKIDRSLYIAKPTKTDDFETKYILGVLNSTLLAFYFRFTSNEFDNLFPKVRLVEFKKLPIKVIPKETQIGIVKNVEKLLILNQNLNKYSYQFLESTSEEKQITLTNNINNFHSLSFDEFKRELKKQKISFALGEENDRWRDYFQTTVAKIRDLQLEIDKTDKEIDHMVYNLYGLTDDEIQIVENNV